MHVNCTCGLPDERPDDRPTELVSLFGGPWDGAVSKVHVETVSLEIAVRLGTQTKNGIYFRTDQRDGKGRVIFDYCPKTMSDQAVPA